MFGEHMYGTGGGVMWLIWIFIILVIVWILFSTIGNRDKLTEKRPSALDILKERYVKGEINQEEFEQMRKVLDS